MNGIYKGQSAEGKKQVKNNKWQEIVEMVQENAVRSRGERRREWRRRDGSEYERSTGRIVEGRGRNEKIEDEEDRKTVYCDVSLVSAKVFSFDQSVFERAEPRGDEQRTRTRGKSVEWIVHAATHQWDETARAYARGFAHH